MKVSNFFVPGEVVKRTAAEMRQILNRDLDEIDIQLEVQLYTASLGQDVLEAVWEEILNASERRAWKNFLSLDEFIRDETLRVEKLNVNH